MEPVLLRARGAADSRAITTYLKAGGYEGWKKALAMGPDAVTKEVSDSELRGRGGAGFPTGRKWSFVPKDHPGPRYLVCNADESEPGTFKDREIIEYDPHQVIEGVAIASFAIKANTAYIYVRGEFVRWAQILEEAIAEARQRGFLGKNVLGSGFDIDVWVHRGAGAYICGEETALLESIEGKRGFPRLKPPFPAVVGLFGKPTVINNVETLACVPHIITRGAAWFAGIGRAKNTGPKLFGVSGHVNRPGVYELPLGVTFREIIEEHAGGVRGGRKLKAVIPGGSSVPVVPGDVMLKTNMDYDSLRAAGSAVGSAAVIVMDETTCMVRVLERISRFYMAESCGQCTPCREGTGWMNRIVKRILAGQARREELDLLVDVANRIEGHTICALGDAAAWPVQSFMKHYRHEFEYMIDHGGRSMVADQLGARAA